MEVTDDTPSGGGMVELVNLRNFNGTIIIFIKITNAMRLLLYFTAPRH